MWVFNWKTTLAGLLTGLPNILTILGIGIPVPVVQVLTGLGALLLGIFAKDFNVTGGSVKQ